LRAVRRIALELHALEPADRRWALSQLTPDERVDVESTLQDLEELGVSAVAREAAGLDAPSRAPTPADAAEPASPETVLANASAEEIRVLLEHEPVSVVAAVLAARPWPWSTSFLRGEPRVRRGRIRRRLSDPGSGVAPAVQQALLELLAHSLEAGAPAWTTSSGFEAEMQAAEDASNAAHSKARSRVWAK